MIEITVPARPATATEEAVPEHNIPETYKNTSPKNHAYIDAEAEAIHMILSGIGDDIYSIVDACITAKEMWIAIERLQQVVKQTVDLEKESYHKLFDIIKQYPNEVNEIHVEKIARNANLLALVAAAQLNNNVTTSLKTGNNSQTGQFGNQRKVTVVGARETVGNQIVQQFGIQCFSCKEFGHFAKEYRKLKRAKDYAYHKENMMLCKHEEKGCVVTYSRPTFDVEPLEKVQFDDDYNVFATERQHSKQPESINDTYVMEKVDSNVIPNSSDMCDDEEKANQNAEENKDERVVLANLIAN
ncbi:hypothetical protein Tco_0410975, partial [Tanacetum coccineum]